MRQSCKSGRALLVRFGLTIDKMSAQSTHTCLVFSPFRYCKSIPVIKITLLPVMPANVLQKPPKPSFFSKLTTETSINQVEIGLKTFFFPRSSIFQHLSKKKLVILNTFVFSFLLTEIIFFLQVHFIFYPIFA